MSSPTIEAQVLASLAEGKSISQTARDAGIHRATVYNWLHGNPAFANALQSSIRHRTAAALDRALELVDPAFDTLRQLIENEQVSPSVRLRAARLIVDFVQASAVPGDTETQPAAKSPMSLEEISENLLARERIFRETWAASRAAAPPAPPQTPRNALCPCGSGIKFKRCCGTSAPPVLNTHGFSAAA